MKYKVGQKLVCKCNFQTIKPEGLIAFNEGKTYTIKEIDFESNPHYPYILESNLDPKHYMKEDYIDKYFISDREEKLKRLLK